MEELGGPKKGYKSKGMERVSRSRRMELSRRKLYASRQCLAVMASGGEAPSAAQGAVEFQGWFVWHSIATSNL